MARKAQRVPNLLFYRASARWTQETLATKSGVNKRTIERGENDLPIAITAIVALAQALQVAHKDLIGGPMDPAQVGHLIGNPLFALETNLDTLRRRLERYNSTRPDLQACSDLAPVFEVLRATERSLIATKEALLKIKEGKSDGEAK